MNSLKISVRESVTSKPPAKKWGEIPCQFWFLGKIKNGGLFDALNFKLNHNSCIIFKLDGTVYTWLDMKNTSGSPDTNSVEDYQPVSIEILATKEAR